MIITSINNNKIKELIKLKEIKYIKKTNRYLIDGLHLVEEAFKNNVVEEIYIEEKLYNNFNFNTLNIRITFITQQISKHISDTVNAQGIFAICKIQEKEFNIDNYKNILILDKIQDPGNMGTIIRTADALGFECIIISQGSVSIYNQKVIRSMQGSNFHIDCFENKNILEILERMQDFDIFATSLDTNKYLEDIKTIKEKRAVIFGNEANGVSREILEKVEKKIKIKMNGKAESMNVAISSAIVMYHLQNIK